MVIDLEQLPDESVELKELITQVVDQYEQVIAQYDIALNDSEQKNIELVHRLNQLLRHRYGRKSEKLNPDQALLFPDLADNAPSQEAEEETEAEQADEEEKPSSKDTGHGRRQLDKLPLEQEKVEYDLSDNERTCEHCGGELTSIGEDTSCMLEYIPATLKVIHHKRHKYSCKHCPDSSVVTAAMPEKPIASGMAGPGLLSHLIVSKYDDHLPLYRQEEIFGRNGIDLARSTLCDWVLQSCELLQPLSELMADEVLKGEVINTDDTGVPVQRRINIEEKSKRSLGKGYVWVYLGDEAHSYVVYDYTTGRTRDGPSAFLSDYRGYLQCDGYSGYADFFTESRGMVEVGCWAHARRKFYDARDSDRRSLEALAFIRRLYEVESEGTRRKLSATKLAKLRGLKAAAILERFRDWLEGHEVDVLPKSPLGAAIGYTLSRWDALNRYIDDGVLSIDNNASERALRHVVIGRKNWLFAGSDRGGRAAAVAYTMIESAKRCGANPYTYLRDVLDHIAGTPISQIDQFLPDRWLAAQIARS